MVNVLLVVMVVLAWLSAARTWRGRLRIGREAARKQRRRWKLASKWAGSGPADRRRAGQATLRNVDMGVVLTEVATRLRSGAAVEAAWAETIAHHRLELASARKVRGSGRGSDGDRPARGALDDDGVPRALRRMWELRWWQRLRLGVNRETLDSLPGAVAVSRMGYATGAPMAEILDSCAVGIIEAAQARSARSVALAGPQSSANMLAALPVVGLALGYMLGVNPFDFLFGSLLGHVALAAGLAFEVAGILVVRSMVASAKAQGV